MDNDIIQIDSSNLSETKDKIEMIIRQTDYDEETARKKLAEYNNDYLKVIKSYFGIEDKIKEKTKIKSLNQEIYRQIRHKMDYSIQDYNKKQEIKLQDEISKLHDRDNL